MCTNNFYSCSFVLCHVVMRVKVFIRGPFTDVTLSPDRSHSCTFVTAEVKYRNRSGKLRQLFAFLSRIFCYREKQNGPIIACQSTITLFCCSEVDLLKKQKKVRCSKTWRSISNRSYSCTAVKYRNSSESKSRLKGIETISVSYPRKEFISRNVSRWICLP